MPDLSRLIAHRGDPSVRPENTLPAVAAAVRAGARFVEFDVQLSADRVPVLLHDATLKRTTGHEGQPMDLPAAQLGRMRADAEGLASPEARIPLLSELGDLLNRTPEVTAFVELKSESIQHFGHMAMVDIVVHTLSKARFPWVLISFDYETVKYAREHHQIAIGWVLHEHDARSLKQAKALAPAYLFCNSKKLPRGKLERGPWSWVIYDCCEWDEITSLLERGATLVETSCITRLARALHRANRSA